MQSLTARHTSTKLKLRDELLTQMRRRFHNIEGNMILASVTLLHLRFRKEAFGNLVAADRCDQHLIQEMTLIDEQDEETPQPEVPSTHTCTISDIWQSIDVTLAEYQSRRTPSSEGIVEIEAVYAVQPHPKSKKFTCVVECK